MPTLPRGKTSLPSTSTACSSARRIRSATSAASGESSTPSRSTANSSPPKRATVSVGRTVAARRRATSWSTTSPAAWPRLSFTVLKSSRSMNMTPTEAEPRCARMSACWTRSTKSARLARLVTGSWKAWCASWSSKALRSLTSRLFRTTPRTCSSCRRSVCWTSNWSHVPSRCWSEHSSTRVSVRSAPPRATTSASRGRSASARRRSKRVPSTSSAR